MKSNHYAKIKISDKNERISVSTDKSRINQNNLHSEIPDQDHSYNLISLLKRNGQPDILYNCNYIKGKDYKIKNADSSSESSPIRCNTPIKFSDGSNHSEGEDDYEQMLKPRRLRYFNAFNISHKCFKCNKGGHLAITCPNETENFCYRCLGKDHLIENCKNFKCFKCNKFGHKNTECKNVEGIKCYRCHALGHIQDDCIKAPIYKREKLDPEYCLKYDHRFSEIANIKKIFILDERESLHDKMIIKLVANPSCPKCSEKHLLERCPRNIYIPKKGNNFRGKKNY